jgi:hypothetical protein
MILKLIINYQMLPKKGNFEASSKFWEQSNTVANGLSTKDELVKGIKKDR